jgi:hypothetical protein
MFVWMDIGPEKKSFIRYMPFRLMSGNSFPNVYIFGSKDTVSVVCVFRLGERDRRISKSQVQMVLLWTELKCVLLAYDGTKTTVWITCKQDIDLNVVSKLSTRINCPEHTHTRCLFLMDAAALPCQPMRDESTTKKQAGSDRNPLIVELLASFALQVEHRNSNVEPGPKMVRVPLLRTAKNGMTRSNAFPCTIAQPPELRGATVTA